MFVCVGCVCGGGLLSLSLSFFGVMYSNKINKTRRLSECYQTSNKIETQPRKANLENACAAD